MRLLLVEGELAAREMLSTVLAAWRYEVQTVRDGHAAVATLEQQDAPRLALINGPIPGIDGAEICRRIRANEDLPYTYLMLLSDLGTQDDVIDGLNAGADDYMVKPVNVVELFGRLRSGRRVLESQAELVRIREELRRQALFDPVTSTLNRRGGLLAMQKELDRSGRTKRPIAIVLCDLDHFKEVNDNYGHLAGDEVLRTAAARMGRVIRPYDSISRYGGEEFLIVLPACDEGAAVSIIERCRASLASSPVRHDAVEISLTASFGLCSSPWQEGLLPEDLIAAADAALYRAKRAGRNRVEIAAPPAPSADTER